MCFHKEYPKDSKTRQLRNNGSRSLVDESKISFDGFDQRPLPYSPISAAAFSRPLHFAPNERLPGVFSSALGLSFLGQLKIDDFNEAHPAHAPVFDIKDFFNLLEGFSFFHHGLNLDLLFFDALNQVLDVFLRSQVAVAMDKCLSIQVQDGLQDFKQPKGASVFGAMDEKVSADKQKVADKSYLFIGKINDGITVRVRRAKIKEIDARASQGAVKIKVKPVAEGDVRKIGMLLVRLKGLGHVATGLLMGNDIYPLRETHQAVDMVGVAVGESDAADGIKSQLLDFRNHLPGCIFGHLGIDDQDFFSTDEKAGVGAHPAFELIDVSLDILNKDGRDFLLQRLCLLRTLMLGRNRGNKTQEKKTEND